MILLSIMSDAAEASTSAGLCWAELILSYTPMWDCWRVMQAVERSSSVGSEGQKVTFNMIKSRMSDLMYKVRSYATVDHYKLCVHGHV